MECTELRNKRKRKIREPRRKRGGGEEGKGEGKEERWRSVSKEVEREVWKG